MKKRILSVSLAFLMVFMLLPLSVSASDVTDSQGVTYTLGSDGTYYSVSDFDDSTSEVVIPSEIDGIPVTSIDHYAFSNCLNLTSIEIPNSVTYIWNYAFYASGLTSIKIPNSVTSIGKGAFSACSNLTSIEISDSVTYVGENAFLHCGNLTSIIVDSENAVYHSKDNCFIETDTNTLIRGCENSIIPNYITTIADYAFNVCDGLISIEIPDTVTSIGNRAFSGCSKLTSVKISNSVTSIGDYAFFDCNSLASIKIPDSVTSIGVAAFSWCVNVESIEIPNSVISIGEDAFSYCKSLTSIKISGSVISIGGSILSDCGKLTSIIVDSENTVYHSKDNCLIETATNKLIRGCQNSIIPGYVTSICDYAFSNCTSLTSIDIPDSVTYIGDSAFSNCTSLASIEIPDHVTSIGRYAFSHCKSLTSINIPNSVISIGKEAFWSCTGLTCIIIPNSVTEMKAYVFNDCTNITDIYCEAESQPEGWVDLWLKYCDATAHWGCNAVINEPTCDEQGYTSRTCDVCGKEYVYDYVPEKGHNYDSVVTEPTCEDEGYTTYTCGCGDSYVGDYVPKNGHTEGEGATCTTDQICTVCGEILEVRLGHNYIAVVTKPICTEGGYTTHTCDRCGDEYVDTYIPENGHTEGEWVIVLEPEIGVEGIEEKRCTVCGELIDTRYIDALIPKYLLGDVNLDKVVDKRDFALLKRYCIGLVKFDYISMAVADVNQDTNVDKRDFVILKRYCLGLTTITPEYVGVPVIVEPD